MSKNDAFEFVLALSPLCLVGLYFGTVAVLGFVKERREERARARRNAKLPLHERCSCPTCAAWRRREFLP